MLNRFAGMDCRRDVRIVYIWTRFGFKRSFMKRKSVFLDRHVLQQDMRIRLPKAVLLNMNVEKGKTMFDIFFDAEDKSLVLKVHENKGENK